MRKLLLQTSSREREEERDKRKVSLKYLRPSAVRQLLSIDIRTAEEFQWVEERGVVVIHKSKCFESRSLRVALQNSNYYWLQALFGSWLDGIVMCHYAGRTQSKDLHSLLFLRRLLKN